jgi:hypothetical protein
MMLVGLQSLSDDLRDDVQPKPNQQRTCEPHYVRMTRLESNTDVPTSKICLIKSTHSPKVSNLGLPYTRKNGITIISMSSLSGT